MASDESSLAADSDLTSVLEPGVSVVDGIPDERRRRESKTRSLS